MDLRIRGGGGVSASLVKHHLRPNESDSRAGEARTETSLMKREVGLDTVFRTLAPPPNPKPETRKPETLNPKP